MFNGFPRPKKDGGGGSNIKSIQRGEYAIIATDLTIDITISPVDLSKSIPKICVSSGAGSAQYDAYRCVLTTPTNLQITHASSGVSGASLSWEVIEYNNVKSLQSGLLVLSASPQNLVISTVDTSKADIFISFSVPATSGGSGYMGVNASLNTPTNVKFVSLGATFNFSVNWYVIEFN